MSAASRFLLLTLSVLIVPAFASAQSQSLSPTLPSDTLEANFAPRSAPGPMPELAPSLPSDTLKATEPAEWGESVTPREESAREEEPEGEITLPAHPGSASVPS
jgi:hypothetical protein